MNHFAPGGGAANWDCVSVIDFADTEAAKRYAEHPLHQAFVTEHAIP